MNVSETPHPERASADAASAAQPTGATPAFSASGLGKRYRGNWALRDCSLSLPAGRVIALVGPNGAGKTTLLQLAVGLLAPTQGQVRVFGEPVGGDAALQRVAFLAQDKPLYADFTVSEMLRFGRRLNPRWDDDLAQRRLVELDIPLNRKVGSLSGGQRTQVALTVAVAKRPDLLVLDEPLADLDPLARHDVTRALMAAVAETQMTVLFSSHVVSDLEGTCDWLVVLNRGRVQVSADIDELVSTHSLITGLADSADAIASQHQVVARSSAGRQVSLLVRGTSAIVDPRWTTRSVGMEDIVLAYLRDPDAAALLPPTLTVLN
ncbi:ABC transporter ATP-binding protein [Micromonospora sp. NPDC047134]|uniref:ABC transporter ATP-binding protein n=1 Tax=Micromonospora sp. NPDC047134 TaxID=3154340 RepID=UPI0033E8593B